MRYQKPGRTVRIIVERPRVAGRVAPARRNRGGGGGKSPWYVTLLTDLRWEFENQSEASNASFVVF